MRNYYLGYCLHPSCRASKCSCLAACLGTAQWSEVVVAVKDSSTTLDGNTLKDFVSCTKNIAGMADQDAQLKRQTEDFFLLWVDSQADFI